MKRPPSVTAVEPVAKHLRLVHSQHQPRRRPYAQSPKVSCAHCEKMIPANSIRCPHCGLHFKGGKAYEFAKSSKVKPQRPDRPWSGAWQTGRSRFWLWLLCLFVISLLFAVMSH